MIFVMDKKYMSSALKRVSGLPPHTLICASRFWRHVGDAETAREASFKSVSHDLGLADPGQDTEHQLQILESIFEKYKTNIIGDLKSGKAVEYASMPIDDRDAYCQAAAVRWMQSMMCVV